MADEAQRESLDEERVRAELFELQQQYDTGEVAEEEYDRHEKLLLERLAEIRDLKQRQANPNGG